MKKRHLIVLASLLIVMACGKAEKYNIQSPDGKLTATVEVSTKSVSYSLKYGQKTVIDLSTLGLEIKGMPDLAKNLKVKEVKQDSYDSTWEQPWGEQRFIRNHYNELLLVLEETQKPHRALNLRFRLFDDGLGFRYEFPDQKMKNFTIMQERTQFNLPVDEEAWSIPSPAYYQRYYESLYTKRLLSAMTDTVTTPVTIECKNGLFVSIHEAGLVDYAKMNLYTMGDSHFKTDLSPWSTGEKVYAETPFNTPWRTIAVGQKAGDLITSRLMLNLNESSKIENMNWFTPEVYVGVWWGMHMRKYSWSQGSKHGAATANVKAYIDFAAKNGIHGVLVEGWNEGWNGNWAKNGEKFIFDKPYSDFDIEQLSQYAKSKGVRIIGHHETAGSSINYEKQLDAAFAFCNKYNINTVKTGYVSQYLDGKEVHDGQYGVRHMMKVVQAASKYNVAIVNHEPIMPTGVCRTWPNLVSQEGMRGQEYDAWSPDGGNPPSHTTILPFTRGLAGPMDFTPGTFNFTNPAKPKSRVQTTLAKQLALYVVLYSPVQMASDLIENYEGKPEFDFIRKVACDWEETLVPDAVIGQYVVTARKDRNSDRWFLGAITNQQQRDLQVDLSFLTDGVQYKAFIYQDGEGADWRDNPCSVQYSVQVVDNKSSLLLSLASGGGAAIRFEVCD